MIWAVAICLAGSPLRLDSEWAPPNYLPFARTHAVAATGPGAYAIGGLRGLYRGKPGSWQKVDERPVKQLVQSGGSVWALFGDGSVDKLDFDTDRLVFDVMSGRLKRPWVASLTPTASGLLCGGSGGWAELAKASVETYPKELEGQVVTAIARTGGTVWVGTQRKGLFAFSGGKSQRFGFAAGLPDSWVTALLPTSDGLVVAVADGGLVRISDGKVQPIPSPSKRPRLLAQFRSRLVVGGMEGCWLQDGKSWQQLSSEETTCLTAIGDKLAVGTPYKLMWWR